MIAPRQREGASDPERDERAAREIPDISDLDLLRDLRNLIVNEDSDRIREILEILSYLRAKVDDPEGLVRTLKPVIGEILAERIAEAPEEMAKILAPAVSLALAHRARENRAEVARALRPAVLLSIGLAVAGRAGTGLGNAFLRLLAFFRLHRRPAEALAPTRERRPKPTGFGIRDLFLLGRGSLLLLAHGTWNPESTHLRAEGRLLPLVRRFIRTALDEGAPSPLRARFEDRTVVVELGRHVHVVAVYTGDPPVGFLPDLRQALADVHARIQGTFRAPFGEGPELASVRPVLRILLDRYRPSGMRPVDASAESYDPIRYPGPQASARPSRHERGPARKPTS